MKSKLIQLEESDLARITKCAKYKRIDANSLIRMVIMDYVERWEDEIRRINQSIPNDIN